MSDPELDPDVTPEQEARLRRLLARARHDEPVPDDIAARLDRVLEQLGSEEAAPGPADGRGQSDSAGSTTAAPGPHGRDAELVALASRRRRRVGVLLAAAAVVVVGLVGVGQLIDPEAGSEALSADAGDSQAAQAEQNDAPDRGTGDLDDSAGDAAASGRQEGAAAPEATAPSSPDATAPSADADVRGAAPLIRVTSRGFTRAADRFRDRPGVLSRAGTPLESSRLSTAADFVCPTTSWGAGQLLAVLYDGVPSVLAYREPTGDSQVVDLLQCGSGDVVRSTTLGRR